MIPLLKPNLPKPSKWARYIKKSYETFTFANTGPCTSLLEERLQKYLNVNFKPVLMCNATIGLTVVLESLGLTSDSEVLMPSFTFSATAHSVLNAKLKPVLVDCDLDSFLDLENAKSKITKNTKVMVVVQALGFSCDYKKYEKFCKKHNLKLIFDSAALLGAKYSDGKMVGNAGDFEVFSLHATKTFGIGEGCLVTSKNRKSLDLIRQQINFGFKQGYSVTYGNNAKISEFHSAIGNAVLDSIESKIKKKERVANLYKKYLKDCNVCFFNHNSAYQVFPLVFKDKKTRDKINKILSNMKIGTRIYYVPIHVQPFFKNLNVADSFKNSDYLFNRILCVPFFETLKESEVKKISELINKHC
jgi:dTDP-4-amino-4,6-dideoxygalactose transaminase